MATQENSPITFFMVGCQRCGTTWTDAALREHPEVFVPSRKQSYFFDRNLEKGIDWYMERFDGIEPHHKAVGEVATGYCRLEAISAMANQFPKVKLMMVMRNPIDRAYSNYQSRRVELQWASFEDAIESDSELLDLGQYMDQIDELLKYYKRDQILFLLYEDLHADEQGFIQSIFEFLGVNQEFESTMIGQRKNASMFPKLRNRLNRLGLQRLVIRISKSWIGDCMRRSRKRKGNSYQPMKQETKKKLIEHFTPYNEKLSAFLQRDLSDWDVV